MRSTPATTLTSKTVNMNDPNLNVKSGPFQGKPQQWFTRAEVLRLMTLMAKQEFYLGGPYEDGIYVICETATGRVRHRFDPKKDDYLGGKNTKADLYTKVEL